MAERFEEELFAPPEPPTPEPVPAPERPSVAPRPPELPRIPDVTKALEPVLPAVQQQLEREERTRQERRERISRGEAGPVDVVSGIIERILFGPVGAAFGGVPGPRAIAATAKAVPSLREAAGFVGEARVGDLTARLARLRSRSEALGRARVPGFERAAADVERLGVARTGRASNLSEGETFSLPGEPGTFRVSTVGQDVIEAEQAGGGFRMIPGGAEVRPAVGRFLREEAGQGRPGLGLVGPQARVVVPSEAGKPGQEVVFPYAGIMQPSGAPVRGTVIAVDDPRIPDELYHVTSNAPAVRESGLLRAGGKGGLGGDARDEIVSFTTDFGIAAQLKADMKLSAEVSNLDRAAAIERLTSESQRVRGAGPGAMGIQGGPFSWPPHPVPESWDVGDMLSSYFTHRGFRTDLKDPIFFTRPEALRSIDPANVDIIAVPRGNLRTGALVTDLDLANPFGLKEVRIYGDVPLPGAVGRFLAEEAGLAPIGGPLQPLVERALAAMTKAGRTIGAEEKALLQRVSDKVAKGEQLTPEEAAVKQRLQAFTPKAPRTGLTTGAFESVDPGKLTKTIQATTQYNSIQELGVAIRAGKTEGVPQGLIDTYTLGEAQRAATALGIDAPASLADAFKILPQLLAAATKAAKGKTPKVAATPAAKTQQLAQAAGKVLQGPEVPPTAGPVAEVVPGQMGPRLVSPEAAPVTPETAETAGQVAQVRGGQLGLEVPPTIQPPETAGLEAVVRGGKIGAPVVEEQLQAARRVVDEMRAAGQAEPEITQRLVQEFRFSEDQAEAVARAGFGAEAGAPAGGMFRGPTFKTAEDELTAAEQLFDVLQVPKAIVASADISAGGRQGLPFLFAHPKVSVGAYREQFRSFFRTPEEFEKTAQRMWMRTGINLAQSGLDQDELYIALAGRGYARGEEAFASKLANKIPVVGRIVERSEQAHVMWLNYVRSTVFNNIVESQRAMGHPLPTEEARRLVNYLNHASGRGFQVPKVLAGRAALSAFNAIGFSPQFRISRIRFLGDVVDSGRRVVADVARGRPPSPADMEGLRLGLGYISAVGSAYVIAHWGFGVDINFDATHTLFGKIPLGKARLELIPAVGAMEFAGLSTQTIEGEVYLDPTRGVANDIRTAARELFGVSKTAKGKRYDLSKPSKGPFAQTRGTVLGNYLCNALSPGARATSDFLGYCRAEEVESMIDSPLAQLTVFLWIQNALEAGGLGRKQPGVSPKLEVPTKLGR